VGRFASFLLLLTGALGCSLGGVIGDPSSGPAGPPDTPFDPTYAEDASAEGNDGSALSDTTPMGLPCEASNVLYAYCTGCHSNPPVGGAIIPMLTREDLLAPSPDDPSLTVGERALLRMRAAGVPPMPPVTLPPVPPADVDTFAGWVMAGMPAGTCGDAVPVPAPADTPTVCTSDTYVTGTSERLEARMQPGGACIDCHSRDEGPNFSIAGTVYPTAHEPDECVGATSSDIEVEITDATGAVFTLSVNSSGNFYRERSAGTVTMPIRARVIEDGRIRAMIDPVPSGDCNSCHTERGSMDAPGRIMEP
jgi:hypothetical protein